MYIPNCKASIAVCILCILLDDIEKAMTLEPGEKAPTAEAAIAADDYLNLIHTFDRKSLYSATHLATPVRSQLRTKRSTRSPSAVINAKPYELPMPFMR